MGASMPESTKPPPHVHLLIVLLGAGQAFLLHRRGEGWTRTPGLLSRASLVWTGLLLSSLRYTNRRLGTVPTNRPTPEQLLITAALQRRTCPNHKLEVVMGDKR